MKKELTYQLTVEGKTAVYFCMDDLIEKIKETTENTIEEDLIGLRWKVDIKEMSEEEISGLVTDYK